MKNGVYLLLGLLLLINRSANGIDDDNPSCKYDDDNTKFSAKCYHDADIATFKPDNYVSMANLSTNILNLTLQTTHSPQWKWRVNSLDYFKRYEFLTSLQIFGEMSFAPDLDPRNLKIELFNIPTLKTLSLYYNGFNSVDHLWALPSQLSSITVVGNDYDEFSFIEAPNLQEITFHHTSLTSLPELPRPPPLLKMVDFRNNHVMEINVDTIASFCRVNSLSLDGKSLQSPDKFCECIRMKQWIDEVLKESETKIFSKPLTCFNASKEECRNNNLSTALKNRELCLEQPNPEEAAVDTGGSGPFSKVLLYVGVGVVVLTIASLISLVTYKFFIANPSSATPLDTEKFDDDRMDDDDMHDDYRSDDERDDVHESDVEVFDDEESIDRHTQR